MCEICDKTELLLDLLLQKLKSVNGAQYIAVGIHLQQVAEMRVEPKPSDGEGWVVVEKHYLFGVS